MAEAPLPLVVSGSTAVAGFTLGPSSTEELAGVAAQVLADPILFSKLCDRVYELLQTDLRHQRERAQGYGRRI